MAQVEAKRRPPRVKMTPVDRQHTVRLVNVRLLLATAVAVAVLSAGGYLWYGYRADQLAEAQLQRAAALEQQEQWQEATVYLRRYLQLRPADVEARVRLVEALEHSAVTRRQRRNLVALLYETTGLLQDRVEIRLKLARQLLELGEFGEAETEARKIEDAASEADRAAARRVIAISLGARARPGGLVSVEQAAMALAAALADHPADEQVATMLAHLYRSHPDHVGESDAASAADAVMDNLVEAAPDDPEALLARYHYRLSHALPDRRRDLEALLALDPDHVEALLFTADEALGDSQTSSPKAVEDQLLRVVELAPTDPRGYLALGRLHSLRGDHESAVAILTEGRAKLVARNLELDHTLAGLLIEVNKIEEAGRIAADIQTEVRRLLPELSSIDRIRLENAHRLLQARLDVSRGQLPQAARELSAVIASTADLNASGGTLQLLQARALLATVMGQMQRLDLAAAHWEAVADQAPRFMDAGWKAGSAYLEMGRPAEAIVQLERYLELPSAAAGAWVSLAQAHLQRQLQLAKDQQNWSELLATLEQAKQKLPTHPELILVEALYEAALDTDQSQERATQRLREIEASGSESRSLWKRLVLIYQQLGAREDAKRALKKYEELENDRVQRATLRAAALTRGGRAEEALELFVEAEREASEEQRVELRIGRLQVLLATGDLEEAYRLAAESLDAMPQTPRLLTMALELALAHGDLEQAKRWEDALRTQADVDVDDINWRYFRARRMIEEYSALDTSERGELGALVESLRAARPNWYPVVALAARHAELQGNTRRALDQYQLAVELGDARPRTLERLVAMLHAKGRYSEAEKHLSRIAGEGAAQGGAESMAIVAAVRENRLEKALEIARRVVESGSTDPMHHVWLGSLLSIGGQQEAAEEVFADTVARFPQDSRVWNGWFTHLVRTGQAARAREILIQWNQQAAGDELAKRLALAQGYVLLGDAAAAQQEYQQILARDARSVEALFRLGRLLLKTDTVQARALFERVLQLDAAHDEARRHLATLLAASGDQDDWNRAIGLLATTQESAYQPSAGADDRLRAILVSRRGRNRQERLRNYETARQILSERLARVTAPEVDVDLMLLAGIYEREANLRQDATLLQSARESLRPLVDRSRPQANYLVLYLEFLLRHLGQPAAGETESQFDERRAVFAADARLRINELEAALGERHPDEYQILPVAFRARLAGAQQQDEEARRLLAEFAQRVPDAEDGPDRARFYLTLGRLYSLIGDHQEAEGWYRRLAAQVPRGYVPLAQCLVQQGRIDEAVSVCLEAASEAPSAEVATLLAQLLSTPDSAGVSYDRAWVVIHEALDTHGDNVELLMSVAVQKVIEGENAEAVQLFRRVVEIDPNHSLALNNLATLLAEQPNRLREARQHIERAIEVAGRHPALLDTWGTILARLGEHEQAVSVLEESVAGGAADPRYYFHLAFAYERAGRTEEAREALKAARERGLESAILTRGDRELKATLTEVLLTGEVP